MKKDNNINNYLNIACKALGAVVSIVTIAKGIKQLCTSESPAKKRKEDEKFFERKQQILVQAHQEKVKADTASYEEKRRIDAKYKNATHPNQAITISSGNNKQGSPFAISRHICEPIVLLPLPSGLYIIVTPPLDI